MSIINTEEGTLGPRDIATTFRLNKIQNYADFVFVVVPHDTLIRCCRIRLNQAITLGRDFSRLKIRHLDSEAWLQFGSLFHRPESHLLRVEHSKRSDF